MAYASGVVGDVGSPLRVCFSVFCVGAAVQRLSLILLVRNGIKRINTHGNWLKQRLSALCTVRREPTV